MANCYSGAPRRRSTDLSGRHHLLQITLPDGEVIPSMVLVAAQIYRDYTGQGAVELPPTDSHGFWYLPFCGQPGDLGGSISVADLIPASNELSQ